MNKLIAASLVSIGIAAAAPAAIAQTADPAAAPAPGFGQRHHEQRAFRLPSERMEAQLAYIRTALKITDAQLPQWDAYAGVRRKQAAAMDKRVEARRAQMAKGPSAERQRPNVVERHERQRERMIAGSQRLEELIAVEKPLFAALSPEQQRVANEVLSPRGRAHGGPGRGHPRGGFARG